MLATRGANIIGDVASGSQKNMAGEKKTGLWASLKAVKDCRSLRCLKG